MYRGAPWRAEKDSSTIVLFAQDGPSTRAIYHALTREFANVSVILEQPLSRSQLLRRRAKKLGLRSTVGQLLFVTVAVPILRWRGRRRIERISRQYELDLSPISGAIVNVPSVNSEEAREALRRLKPSAVVVNGTRIIGKDTLRVVQAPFINTHAGVTPLYRGVHGGYWALAEGRPDLVGTTVHLIDDGIDTGKPLARVIFPVSKEDSFATYPYLHISYGMPALLDVVRKAVNGGLEPQTDPLDVPSRLRYHPTLWGYISTRIRRGVR